MQWRNFGLKIGGTKLEAPKAQRIETPKASKGGGMTRGHPSQPTRGLRQWSE